MFWHWTLARRQRKQALFRVSTKRVLVRMSCFATLIYCVTGASLPGLKTKPLLYHLNVFVSTVNYDILLPHSFNCFKVLHVIQLIIFICLDCEALDLCILLLFWKHFSSYFRSLQWLTFNWHFSSFQHLQLFFNHISRHLVDSFFFICLHCDQLCNLSCILLLLYDQSDLVMTVYDPATEDRK